MKSKYSVMAMNKKICIIEMFTRPSNILRLLLLIFYINQALLVMKSDIKPSLSIIKLSLRVNLWSVFTFGSTAAVRI
jgi:hypothetical protein